MKPHISGSSAQHLVPGVAISQDIHNRMITTINVYTLISPRGRPNLKGDHNTQHLQVYNVITIEALGNGNGINKIVITTPQTPCKQASRYMGMLSGLMS